MTDTTLPSSPPARLNRATAARHAAIEYQRFVAMARSLAPADWSRPTDCPAWDVRAMTGHVLGMMDFVASVREFGHVIRAGQRAANGRPLIDGMTEVQVADRAHLTPAQLIEQLAEQAPRAARARRRLPAPLRWFPMSQEVGGVKETWRLGYLFDVILTRDTWLHRVDICRATGRSLVLTVDHDARLVADVVAEWARRHGQPYQLTLTGPAGGDYASGTGGEAHTLDAIEFCRILSGRGVGTGLLAQPVPF